MSATMMTWSFYNSETGEFTNRCFSGPDRSIIDNTPQGHIAMPGVFDHLSQRVDLATGEVVDYQPATPSADHEWSDVTRRWQLKPEVMERDERRATAQAAIVDFESKQPRILREIALDPTNADALQRLKSMDAAIAEQRAIIQQNT